jgi:HD superfamily phosphodiesterase
MNILKAAEEFAKIEYLKNDSFHQWHHIEDVQRRADEICALLNDKTIDLEALRLAIIFHDIDYRTYDDHPDASVKVARSFLSKNGFSEQKMHQIQEIMLDHSSPHRKVRGDSKTLEGKIIFDADKSIFITTPETYKKYFPLLYFPETRDLVAYRP